MELAKYVCVLQAPGSWRRQAARSCPRSTSGMVERVGQRSDEPRLLWSDGHWMCQDCSGLKMMLLGRAVHDAPFTTIDWLAYRLAHSFESASQNKPGHAEGAESDHLSCGHQDSTPVTFARRSRSRWYPTFERSARSPGLDADSDFATFEMCWLSMQTQPVDH